MVRAAKSCSAKEAAGMFWAVLTDALWDSIFGREPRAASITFERAPLPTISNHRG